MLLWARLTRCGRHSWREGRALLLQAAEGKQGWPNGKNVEQRNKMSSGGWKAEFVKGKNICRRKLNQDITRIYVYLSFKGKNFLALSFK